MIQKSTYEAPHAEQIRIQEVGVLMGSNPDMPNSSAETLTIVSGTWDD